MIKKESKPVSFAALPPPRLSLTQCFAEFPWMTYACVFWLISTSCKRKLKPFFFLLFCAVQLEEGEDFAGCVLREGGREGGKEAATRSQNGLNETSGFRQCN